MNIDDLKNNWNSISFPPGYGGVPETSELMSRVRAGRVSTLRDRLASIGRGLSLLCLFGIFLMIPYLAGTTTLAILAICYFIFMASMHFRNYRRVCRLDFSRMSVCEALSAVCIIEASRVRLRAIGMALGLPLALYMCFTFTSVYGEYMLYGCIAGALLGLAIGLAINRRAVSIIREMRAQLSSADSLQ